MYRSKILVVDDEPSITGALELILESGGYDVVTARSVEEANSALARRPADLVFTDLRLPGSPGTELLRSVKRDTPDTQVILMTAFGSVEITVEAIKQGAYYYLEKPFTPEQVLVLAERALQFGAVKRENRNLKIALSDEGQTYGIIGRNSRMHQIHEIIRTTAPADASVLIEGESGTGKELIATAFHTQSPRYARPFIRINCAAIPYELIESELFGYRKGAFTGADRDRRGLIEAAAGGTLMLDEITEMPTPMQTKLLRVLQERRLRRLGDEREIDVDFRLISTTNRDTAELIRDGEMRKDLYFRISTIKIKVPPLRERLDDVALLAERFLQRYAEKYSKRIRTVSQPALALLARYEWPGNVRELESVIEHAVLFAREDELRPEDMPEQLHSAQSELYRCVIPPFLTMEEIEREAIVQTLERTGGNVKRTAEILNYHRPTLYRKLKKFGIRPDAPVETNVAEASTGSAEG